MRSFFYRIYMGSGSVAVRVRVSGLGSGRFPSSIWVGFGLRFGVERKSV